MANKTFNNVKLNIAFTKADNHTTNIASGDNIANSIGKIAKWYDDFHDVVWTGDAATVNGKTVAVNVPANAKFTDTTYDVMTAATASAAGTQGLVPAPAAGKQTAFLRGDGTWVVPTNTTYSVATASKLGLVKSGGDITIDANGIMSVADNSHNHTIANVTGLQTALDGKVDNSKIGVANGVASLDENGLVPSSQLPSYVDDVIEGYLNSGKFYKESAHTTEITAEAGKIYVDSATNKTYRWSGTAYVEISASLALGTTSSTAFRGDQGKTAYDHSQVKTGNPHNVTKTDVGLGNVENKSSATIRSEITKANVTDALGYTPPEQDTTYSAATTSAAGLMSAADKTKLNGIAAGAEVNQNAVSSIKVGDVTVAANAKTDTFELVGSTNVTLEADAATKKITIKSANTTYSNMTAATASAAGKAGLVPAPPAGSQNKFLRGDGTWQSTAYTLPTATASALGGIKVGSNLSIASGVLSAKTLVGATASAAGTAGYAPAPTTAGFTEYTTVNNQFLCGDGTWSSKPVIEEDTLILNCVAG